MKHVNLFSSSFIEMVLAYNIYKFNTYNMVIDTIYYKILSTKSLINISVLLYTTFLSLFFSVNINIYPFSNFQVYNTVLLIVIIMLYIRSLELIHLTTEFILFDQQLSIFPSSKLWQSPFCYFYEFGIFQIPHISENISF